MAVLSTISTAFIVMKQTDDHCDLWVIVQTMKKQDLSLGQILLLLVRPAWALFLGLKSRMVKAVVAIAQGKGFYVRWNLKEASGKSPV